MPSKQDNESHLDGGLMEGYISNKSIFGRKNKNSSGMEALFNHYCSNDTANLNWNDKCVRAEELIQVSDPFCDNVVQYCIVDAEHCVGNNCSEAKELNSKLQNLYKSNGIMPKLITAIGVRKDSKKPITAREIEIYRKLHPGSEAKEFRKQFFKISMEDSDVEHVLDVLNKNTAGWSNDCNVHYYDVDMTFDCKHTFDREEAVAELLNKGFRLESSYDKHASELEDGEGTILDNKKYVSKSCLTFWTNIRGAALRCKWYNKFVQSLESGGGVRSSSGMGLANFINNPGSRVQETIKRTSEFGYTRCEITWSNCIPYNLEEVLQNLNYLRELLTRKSLYVNPISNQWRIFASCLRHTLAIFDRQSNHLLFGWSYNSDTKKINGVLIKNATEDKVRWVLKRCSLANHLPIDLLKCEFEHGKIIKKNKEVSERNAITGVLPEHFRYFRYGDNQSQIIKKGALFYSAKSLDRNKDRTLNQPSDLGIMPQPNIDVYIEQKSVNVKSAAKGMLQQIGDAEILAELCPLYSSASDYKKVCADIAIEYKKIGTQTEYRERADHYKTIMRTISGKMIDLEEGATLDIVAIRRMTLNKAKGLYTWQVCDGKTAYYADENTRRNLDLAKLNLSAPEDSTQILHNNNKVLFTLIKGKDTCIGGNKKAVCTINYLDGDCLEGGDFDDPKEMEYILRRESAVRHCDCDKLDYSEEGLKYNTTYKLTHYTTYEYRRSTKYAIGFDHREGWFASNFWFDKLIAQQIKKKATDTDNPDIKELSQLEPFEITFTGEQKRTPHKRKEILIKLA